RAHHNVESTLDISEIDLRTHDSIVEGSLQCPDRLCRREFPIIDGIPLLILDIRDYVANHVQAICGRSDLSPRTESVLGDCCGPGSMYDTLRTHLSSYAWDHYGDLAPSGEPSGIRPGGVVTALTDAIQAAGQLPPGPWVDLGCSVGRSTFELAERTEETILGIDLNFSMLRMAMRVLSRGEVRYPLRQVGVVYERQQYDVEFPGADRVDFWAADVGALPFRSGTFANAVGLNVLDCLPSPYAFLQSMPQVIAEGGKILLTTPFDWSPTATPLEGWIGGHSQRGDDAGRSESTIQRLFAEDGELHAAGLRVDEHGEGPRWHVRLHARSTMLYQNYRLILQVARQPLGASRSHGPRGWGLSPRTSGSVGFVANGL
ncbi:MAG: methyltransferase domain-containing protein, partial [Planctomycetales bacterium]|nr:methyltransferase domain-containing protein [Planctomycetales bacterium]